MHEPCALIQDLLPLYRDGVCSDESRQAVEYHLKGCPACRAALAAMEAETPPPPPFGEAGEKQKAASFESIRRHFRLRTALAAGAAAAFLLLCGFGSAAALKQSEKTVEYTGNLSVSMEAGDLVGYLEGSDYCRLEIKRVGTPEGDWLFYRLTDTRWDDLTIPDGVFSSYLLCGADKGAGTVTRVYYYTGDLNGLASLSGAELEAAAEKADLLWQWAG